MITTKLKTIDLFKTLTEDELNQIAKMIVIKKFSRDNILFYEGEEPNYFYMLLEGKVKLYKTNVKGHEVVLHYFTQPTMIAEMASLEHIKFPATAIAINDETTVALLDKTKFLELLKSNSDFSFSIIKSLTKKIKQLEVAINRNLIYDALTKVCSFIHENPKILENSKNKEIAVQLNMAPETFSRVLKKLKSHEILNQENRVINNEKLLMFLAF
jgi:CRP/FNR family transcriptional regulator